jgi:hypothetical protein
MVSGAPGRCLPFTCRGPCFDRGGLCAQVLCVNNALGMGKGKIGEH